VDETPDAPRSCADQLRDVAEYLEQAESILPLVESEEADGLCAAMANFDAWLHAELAEWAARLH
jgi:hypothetical protein